MAAVTLIALRVGIGFHFFSEGLDKLLEPRPFTGPFFENAKGPMAPFYQDFVWDPDGLLRLGYVPSTAGESSNYAQPGVDTEPTLAHWDAFRARVGEYYAFNEEQSKQADEILERYKQVLAGFVIDYGEDLREYFFGIERRNRNGADVARQNVASLRGQTLEVEAKVRQARGPLLAQINAMWSGLERDLNSVSGQGDSGVEIGRLGSKSLDSESLDKIIPWFDILIGVSLMLGLLTRLSCALAVAFLAGVIAAQWPGAVGAAPTWAQFIEALALVHLGVIGAGKYGGLDNPLWALCSKCCRSKRGT